MSSTFFLFATMDSERNICVISGVTSLKLSWSFFMQSSGDVKCSIVFKYMILVNIFLFYCNRILQNGNHLLFSNSHDKFSIWDITICLSANSYYCLYCLFLFCCEFFPFIYCISAFRSTKQFNKFRSLVWYIYCSHSILINSSYFIHSTQKSNLFSLFFAIIKYCAKMMV